MLNLHGLKIKGLKKASGETETYTQRDGRYNEIFYDRESGEVWTMFQCCLGQNSWTQYHNKNIIKVCNTSKHMTMQEIADAIYSAVNKV